MTVYEVFRQERKGQPFQHAGSLPAPDASFAEVYAREQYGRRGESVALWVVPRDAIHGIHEFVDELERNYHRVDGYSLKGKLSEARERANTELLERIRSAHEKSRRTYGVPRMMSELTEAGEAVGHNRVARLMRENGLVGASRRKGCWTTRRNKDARPAPDLVERKFVADAPDRLWVADITYVPTWAGFLYLAVVLDVFSRRIVGWAMANHLRTELILGALDMALERRRPAEVIHHSDQGCQYTSIEFGSRCRDAGVRPSMGSVGDCFDNAMCESFFATLECELLAQHKFHSQAQAVPVVFEFIEGFYNTQRRHSALGYISPIAFENRRNVAFEAAPSEDGFAGCPQSHDHASA